MPELHADESILTFESDAYSDEIRVVQMSGREGISSLFSFRLDLAARDSEIDLDAIVGARARLDIHHTDGTRPIFGIVCRMEQGIVGESFTSYYAELVPSAWMLTQRYRSHIYQNLTVREIIEEVLTDSGLASDEYRFALQRTYPQRVYCVQYREPHWSFLSRLMEEEGIFYFFEHVDGKDVLVMADAADVHVPIEEPSSVLFREQSGLVEAEEFVFEFRYSQQIRPGAAAVRDFNFEKPQVDLTKNDTGPRDTDLEIYDFPGIYDEDTVGGDLARIRLEALQARRRLAQGQSVCRRMLPGFKFSMEEHPRESFNAEYLLIAVQHEATQPLGQDDAGGRYHYANSFRAIPGDVPFRPTRVTPKPVVEGVQTAIVVGPSGEEIHTEEYGRVKVQFHWDREGANDENSSCWIRVSQLWAGASWGAMFIPRIGHEVIVEFLEGDPDRPIIIGRVYNADNMPPYALDDEKTKSTIKSNSSLGGGGSNEYRFEDKAGSEEIYQHAQKDLTIKTENDKNQNTGHDETLAIGNDRTKTVGNDETNTIDNNRTTEINNGDEKLTVKTGDRIIEINTGDDKHTVKTGDRIVEINTGDDKLTVKTGNRIIEVNTGNNDLTVKSGNCGVGVNAGNHVVKAGIKAKLEAAAGREVKVTGGNYEVDASADVKLKGGANVMINAPKIIITGGTEVKLVVGGSSITLTSGGIDIAGTKITSVASGDNEVKGATVKINS